MTRGRGSAPAALRQHRVRARKLPESAGHAAARPPSANRVDDEHGARNVPIPTRRAGRRTLAVSGGSERMRARRPLQRWCSTADCVSAHASSVLSHSRAIRDRCRNARLGPVNSCALAARPVQSPSAFHVRPAGRRDGPRDADHASAPAFMNLRCPPNSMSIEQRSSGDAARPDRLAPADRHKAPRFSSSPMPVSPPLRASRLRAAQTGDIPRMFRLRGGHRAHRPGMRSADLRTPSLTPRGRTDSWR